MRFRGHEIRSPGFRGYDYSWPWPWDSWPRELTNSVTYMLVDEFQKKIFFEIFWLKFLKNFQQLFKDTSYP